MQKLPWERHGAFADMVSELRAMKSGLDAALRPKPARALTSEAISDLLQEEDIDDLPKLWPNFSKHLSGLREREVCDIAEIDR